MLSTVKSLPVYGQGWLQGRQDREWEWLAHYGKLPVFLGKQLLILLCQFITGWVWSPSSLFALLFICPLHNTVTNQSLACQALWPTLCDNIPPPFLFVDTHTNRRRVEECYYIYN